MEAILEKHGSSESFEKLYSHIWPSCQQMLESWLGKKNLYNFTDMLIFDVADIREFLGEQLHRDFPLIDLHIKMKFVLKSNLEELSFNGGFEEQTYNQHRLAYIEMVLEFPKNHDVDRSEAFSSLKYMLRHELQHVYEKVKNRSRSLLIPQDRVMDMVTQEYPELAKLMHKLYLISKGEMNANIASYTDESQTAKKIAYDLRNFNVEETMKLLLEEAKENGYNHKVYYRTFGKWLHRIYKDALKDIEDTITNKEHLVIPSWVEQLKNRDMSVCLNFLAKKFKLAGDYMYRKLSKRITA
jgi:hypothetical protein